MYFVWSSSCMVEPQGSPTLVQIIGSEAFSHPWHRLVRPDLLWVSWAWHAIPGKTLKSYTIGQPAGSVCVCVSTGRASRVCPWWFSCFFWSWPVVILPHPLKIMSQLSNYFSDLYLHETRILHVSCHFWEFKYSIRSSRGKLNRRKRKLFYQSRFLVAALEINSV